jgi:hypothetical protein
MTSSLPRITLWMARWRRVSSSVWAPCVAAPSSVVRGAWPGVEVSSFTASMGVALAFPLPMSRDSGGYGKLYPYSPHPLAGAQKEPCFRARVSHCPNLPRSGQRACPERREGHHHATARINYHNGIVNRRKVLLDIWYAHRPTFPNSKDTKPRLDEGLLRVAGWKGKQCGRSLRQQFSLMNHTRERGREWISSRRSSGLGEKRLQEQNP